MRLRLYHHPDGARVAYRELGTGPPLALLHSAHALAHGVGAGRRGGSSDRFRVVLPDLPLHGDSEDRPRHPYTLDWFAEVLARLRRRRARPAAADRRPRHRRRDPAARGRNAGGSHPARVVLMPNRTAPPRTARPAARAPGGSPRAPARLPGARPRAHPRRAARVLAPSLGLRLSARGEPAARDLVRHAFADVPGNPSLARSWAKFARRWPRGPQTQLLDALPAPGDAGAAAVGRRATACIRLREPKRRSSCCPMRSCGCCRHRLPDRLRRPAAWRASWSRSAGRVLAAVEPWLVARAGLDAR